MIRIWKAKATGAQKTAIVLLLILVFWPFQVFISHRFIPGEAVQLYAAWVTLFFTAFYLLLMLYVRRTSPGWPMFPYTGFKKLGMMLFIPCLVYGFSWVNIAVAAPQVFTVLFGNDYSKNDLAIKRRPERSRRSCDYRLQPRSMDFIFFHYCISRSYYSALPEGDLAVNIHGKSSIFGVHVDEIVVNGTAE